MLEMKSKRKNLLSRLAILLAVVAPLGFTHGAPGFAGSMHNGGIRAGSFNIRCATDHDKGERSWNARKKDMAEFLLKLKCDVIGLQEVTPAQLEFIKRKTGSKYGFVYTFRNGDGKSGEAVPVCYSKKRFKLEKSGTFWLSRTPSKHGSKSWGASCPRICTWAVLKDKTTGKKFCFANAHTDHISSEARLNGVKLIVSHLEDAAPGVPVVLVGDHNCVDDDEPAVYLREVYNDAMYVSKTPPFGPWHSFTGWRKRKAVPAASVLRMKGDERNRIGGNRIDYIYVSKRAIEVQAYATVNAVRKSCGEMYSDHFPVVAQIVIR